MNDDNINDVADLHTHMAKGNTPTGQNDLDGMQVETVVPDNDNGMGGPPSENPPDQKDGDAEFRLSKANKVGTGPDPGDDSASNKGQGPAGENL